MKNSVVKIIQISVHPFEIYTSNGSAYKDTIKSNHVYGLGDDSKVYEWGEFLDSDPGYPYRKLPIDWKLYVPK